MLTDVRGTNALTVLVAPSEEIEKTKMFFCPYKKNIVLKYQGNVVSIQPGYNPKDSPMFFVRPQRQAYNDNINYIFRSAVKKDISTVFWIQDQYFDGDPIRTYHCHSCQAPQLYFDNRKAVDYNSKKELNANTEYLCNNCRASMTFMGIVAIREPLLESEL